MTPESLAWVKPLVESLDLALHEGLLGWELESTVDPLRWVLVIVAKEPLLPREIPPMRVIISEWAECNAAHYSKSEHTGAVLRVLLYIEGLHPRQDNNPFEVPDDRRRGRGRDGRFSRPGRIRSNQAGFAPGGVAPGVRQGFEEDD